MKVKRSELVDFLKSQVKGATPVTVVTETEPKMLKTGNPYLDRGIRKLSRVNGMIGFNYENSVNRQRAREDAAPDFESLPRAWGERIPGTPLVEHKGQFYLEVKTERVLEPSIFVDSSGAEIAKELLEPFLVKGSTARQQLEKPVVLRDYKLESIKEIRLAGMELVLE